MPAILNPVRGGGGSVILDDHDTTETLLVIALLLAGAILIPANVTSTAFPVQMETGQVERYQYRRSWGPMPH